MSGTDNRQASLGRGAEAAAVAGAQIVGGLRLTNGIGLAQPVALLDLIAECGAEELVEGWVQGCGTTYHAAGMLEAERRAELGRV